MDDEDCGQLAYPQLFRRTLRSLAVRAIPSDQRKQNWSAPCIVAFQDLLLYKRINTLSKFQSL